MADFDLEQLKSLFENLADRMERTKGDQLNAAELAKIRTIMAAMNRRMDSDVKNKSETTPKDYVNEFWREWRAQDPLKGLKDRQGVQPKGTILNELQTAKRLKDNVTAQESAGRRFVGNVDKMNAGLGRAGGAVESFVKNLKDGGLMATGGGVIGAAFSKIGSYIDDRAGAYRDILASSEGSIGSIQEMNNAVNSATMSSRELADAMNQGSQGARKLGALKWAQLTGSLTRATQAAGNMGLNFEMRQDAQDAFLDILNKQGNLRNLEQGQMISGIQQLVQSSADTAHILGMTRKEALEAARERAADANLTTLIQGMGLNNNALNRAFDTINAMGGPGASQLLKEVLANGAPTTRASAQLSTVNPEILQFAQSLAGQLRTGNDIDATRLAREANAYSSRTRNDPNRLALTQLAIGGADSINPALAEAITTRNQISMFRANDDPRASGTEDPGTVAMLNKEQIDREAVSAFNQAVDSVANSIMNTYGEKLKELTQTTIDAIHWINDTLAGMQNWPSLTANLAIGAAGLVGTLTLLSGSVRMVSGLFGGVGRLLGLGGARGAASAVGGAATRGAAAAAGGRAGGTILGRLTGGAGNLLGRAVPGVARDFMGSAAGKMIKGGAGLGALLEAGGYIFGDKEFSMKNLAKSGLRVGGGVLGGVLGSFLGPVGTVAGGAGGAMAGDWLADKLFGEDDRRTSNATQTPQNQRPQNQVQRRSQQPANATTNQRGANTLTLDQMTNRIMEASERSVGYLKLIKEQGDKQTDLLREEITVLRTMNDRVVRLLEDGNKNTKSIADHSI